MASFNNQSIYESYTSNISSDQAYSMDSNHADSLHWDQTYSTDPNSANSRPWDHTINSDPNAVYSYPLGQQPSNQVFSSFTGSLDSNNVYADVNVQLNTTPYGYVEQNEDQIINPNPISPTDYNLTDYNSPAIHYPLPQTLIQTPPTSTLANNTGIMTNATSHHGCVIIIMKADINLEKLLSIIQ
ncbi:5824_t:CDS:1 [Paraglomus brasilianum]|uniref:5824_t:CDS:1 n=1 Tax=Paraglomus brasilianum TaxID=144538 RepID=A0A9N9AL32_9GLOM|nr:5824_t:CDS:1 [Paraglomus brasilianum]